MKATFDIVQEWEEPEELQDLLADVRERRADANLQKIRYAFYLAETAHAGQLRASGEPYINHPLAVAKILASLAVDDDSIVSALLHDVLEDTHIYTREQINEYFGPDVLTLVEGVTKLKLKVSSDGSPRSRAVAETARAAESLRKMLLAMASDLRVVVIKLADRLHNMMTLDALPPEKQIRIARETLEIYAPLAARLGIWQVKWQLEDLSFKYLHPKEFQQVSEMVGRARKEREKQTTEVIVTLKEGLQARGIKHIEIQGRPKHLFSIYNKMVKQGFSFEDILDLLAFRIITNSINDCYIALGLVHQMWPPIPNMFTDHIATPKPNGYQSIHTKVLGPHGEPIEVQIRTREMHRIAEFGVAAHWTYKEGRVSLAETTRIAQLRDLLFDWSGDNVVSSDFLRSVSTDLFSEQVYVMTPKGDVLEMPKDSTPVDFAFRVHTQLGLTTVGAKVNGIMVPLSHKLANGDVVELITQRNATPSLDWLEFVRSSHARNKLRAHFRKLSRTDDAMRGRDALERELRQMKLDPKEFLGEEKLNSIVPQFDGVENATDLLAKVGSGLQTSQSVIQKLRGIAPEPTIDRIQTTRSKEGKPTLVLGGIEDVLVKRARCCDPIPGDDIVGYVSRGRGIMIHRKVCPNAIRFELEEQDRLMKLDWTGDASTYGVNLRIVTVNRQGLLMDISAIFGEAKANISAAKIKTVTASQTADIEVTVDVRDTEHLQHIITKISQFTDVISINRLFSRAAMR